MKKVGDLKIGTRLSIVFVFIVALVSTGYIYSIYHTVQIKKEIDKIYNIHLISIDKLIEADRDAYQSSIAISQALSTAINSNSEKFKETIASVIENHKQVKERFTIFENIAYIVKDENNKNLLETFDYNYAGMDSVVSMIVSNLRNRNFNTVSTLYYDKYMKYFDDMRSTLDQYTELTLNEADKSYTESSKVSNDIKNNSIILMFIIIMIIVISTIVLTRSINKPLAFLVKYIEEITAGNLTVTVPKKLATQQDEVGMVLKSMIRMVKKLTKMVKDIKENADNINTQSQQLSVSSQQLSQGANEQAASSEEISASMEEMVANINQNSENAQETEKKATQVSHNASEGYKAVKITVDAMKTITDKISIIGEIAEKTDLLAINAAIEAARAGEHGKGFAVVAAEVRKLAERSQNAAAQINELSSNSMKDAENAGALLDEVVAEIDVTARLVQEITAASLEQDTGAAQINSSVQQFASVTQENSASSEEMAASAEELESQAQSLKKLISFFKIAEDIIEKKLDELDESDDDIETEVEIDRKKKVENQNRRKDNNKANADSKKEVKTVKKEKVVSKDSADDEFEKY